MISRITIKKIGQVLGFMLLASGPLIARDGAFLLLMNGYDAYGQWNLGNSLGQYFLPLPLIGIYCLWDDAWKMPGNYGTIEFKAKGMNDVTVMASRINPSLVKASGSKTYDDLTNGDNAYEFVIGGWANTQTVIRKGSQADPVQVVAAGFPNDPVTGANQLISYKIIFYQDTTKVKKPKNMIAVYYLAPGDTKWTKIISYQDPSYINATQRWVSFTNWDHVMLYQDINVSASTELPPTTN